MIVKSVRYPGLRVHGAGVKFSDGVAEVVDPAALDVLRGLAHMGVEVPDADAPAGASGTGNASGDADTGAGDSPESDDADDDADDADDGDGDGDGDDSADGDSGDTVADPLTALDEAALRALAAERNVPLGKIKNVEKIRERLREGVSE